MTPVFGHGQLRLYLLSLLEEAPRHGYEVIRALEERFGGTYVPSAGTVYPRLARLEEEGLVVREQEGRKAVYRITEAGRQEVRARRDDLAEVEQEVEASIARLAQEVRAQVRADARDLRRELAEAAADARRTASKAPPSPGNGPFQPFEAPSERGWPTLELALYELRKAARNEARRHGPAVAAALNRAIEEIRRLQDE